MTVIWSNKIGKIQNRLPSTSCSRATALPIIIRKQK